MPDAPQLHVLHVASGIDPRQGGLTAAIAGVIAAQLQAGVKVSFVSTTGPNADPAIADRLARDGASVRTIGPCASILTWHRDIKPTLSSLIPGVNIVHIHGVWEEIQHRAARISHALGKPYLFTPHGMLDSWSLSQQSLRKKLYMELRLRRNLNESRSIHCASEIECEMLAPLKLKPPIIVEKPAINLSEFANPPPRGAFRDRFSALRDKPMMLFLGRIHPAKGLELLLAAMKQMHSADTMLVIAGPDEDGYQAKLMDTVRASGLAPRVILTGMLHGVDRVAALADADLFVRPSFQESNSIAVVESLAAGTPVVISDQVSIHRQISENQLGAVVPNEASALAWELTRWITDETLRRDASQRAKTFVSGEFDARLIALRWIDHYRRIILSNKTGLPT